MVLRRVGGGYLPAWLRRYRLPGCVRGKCASDMGCPCLRLRPPRRGSPHRSRPSQNPGLLCPALVVAALGPGVCPWPSLVSPPRASGRLRGLGISASKPWPSYLVPAACRLARLLGAGLCSGRLLPTGGRALGLAGLGRGLFLFSPPGKKRGGEKKTF